MRNTLLILSTLLLLLTGCDKASYATSKVEAQASSPKTKTVSSTTQPRKLFLDVHELGPGKVTASDVANAHIKDLAVQGKYDVSLKAYWVDAKYGKIYCLAEAPSAESINAVHKLPHGLLAQTIMEVSAYSPSWTPVSGMKLYLDVHHLAAGKVTRADVLGAHERDLAVQAQHGVQFLNYWFDEATGTVVCLSEAPDAAATLAAHKQAHGLMPDTIEEVTEGR